MKKYVLAITSGTLFSNNMGCNALTYGAIEVLDAVAKQLGVEFELLLFGNVKGAVIPTELQKFNIKILEDVPNMNSRDLLGGLLHRDFKRRQFMARYLKSADIFLDNGAGDSFSDIYGHARLNSILRKMLLAQKCRKPFIFLPQTIGPFYDITATQKKRVQQVLKSSLGVYARDPLSVACAREIAPGVEPFLTVDVALFMGFQQREPNNGQLLTVGINPSGLLWRGGYTGKNEFGLKSDYKETVRAVVKCLLEINIAVEFVAHDVSGPHGGTRCDDYYVCKLLAREFRGTTVAPFFYGPAEAKSHISGYDALLGSRMHCCIAAYSSGVPVLPLGYSRKFTGLFEGTLNYPHVADLTNIKTVEVLAKLEVLLHKRDAIRQELCGHRRVQLEKWRMDLVDDIVTKVGNFFNLK